MKESKRPVAILAAIAITIASFPLLTSAYPLDGYESTGITRLLRQRLIQEGKIPGKKRPGTGELMPLSMVDLRLLSHKDLDLPTADPNLTAQIKKLIGPEADRYGIALLDLSDIDKPRYAEWHGTQRQNPGSVGKVLVALGIFQLLADIYPDDIEARRSVLRNTMITADQFSIYDHHAVGFFDPEAGTYVRHPLKVGDTGSMYTYLDWMMSPSSNAAAAMLQKQLVLLAHYGAEYPPSPEEEKRFLTEAPKKQLSELFLKAIQEPVTRNGLDLEQLRQGSFFTHKGKQLISGTSSYATPRELTRFALRMEQGRLVDEFSSREIKRLLYVTERRIRYASSGVLRPSAVYFKSGSLYSCQPEEGFTCKKYHGNKRNYMNSLAVVETPAGQNQLFYIVAVLSNVLRKNSAQDHRDLARAIHGKLSRNHPPRPLAPGERDPKLTYGEGFIGYEAERRDLRLKLDTQEALIALGYDIGEIDGLIGPATRKAIQSFQKAQGMNPDGAVSQDLVNRMRKVAEERGLARPYSGQL